MDKLASKEVVDHILSHHGVLGMKWGQRRSGAGSSSSEVSTKTKMGLRGKAVITTSGGKGYSPHPDAIAAKVVKQKLQKSGTHALSNEEMQKLITRQNLEQQIRRTGVGESTYSKGVKTTADLLNRPDTKLAVKVATPRNLKRVKRALSVVGTTAAVALAR